MAESILDKNREKSLLVVNASGGLALPVSGFSLAGIGAAAVAVVDSSGVQVTDFGSGAATGATVPANAFYEGFNAQTALPTAATAGNLVGGIADKYGRQIVIPNAMRDLVGSQFTTITASTAETTIVTAIASTFIDVTAIILINTSSTATRVDIRDTTAGSVIKAFYLPAGDTRGAVFNTPWPQTSVNTNWTATCITSITDLRICVQYIKNK